METTPATPIRPIARGSLRVQSDARLVKLYRRGVEPAFDELVRRYRAKLVGYAGAIAGRDRAEDVVQESLVKAHRSLLGEQQIEPKPWLYTIVRNAALNDIRDNRKHSHDGLGDTASRMSPHDVVERREEFAAVVAAVSDLPASQRQALIGHELGGYTHEEIAAELDLSTGATKQLIYRARLTLRNGFGALIPFPVIAWLVSDTAGVYATGAMTGAAGAGAVSAASGGTAAGTGSGGVLAAIAGAGTTKLAVAAVVAGGSLTAGIAVERQLERSPATPAKASATESGAAAGDGSQGSGGGSPALAAADGGDPLRNGEEPKGADEKHPGSTGKGSSGPGDDGRGGDSGGSGSGGDDSRGGTGDDGRRRPHREDSGHGGSGGHEPDEYEDSNSGHSGGEDRPDDSDDGDDYRPPRPAGDDSSGPGGGDDDYAEEQDEPEAPEAPEVEDSEDFESGANSGSDDGDHSGSGS